MDLVHAVASQQPTSIDFLICACDGELFGHYDWQSSQLHKEFNILFQCIISQKGTRTFRDECLLLKSSANSQTLRDSDKSRMWT